MIEASLTVYTEAKTVADVRQWLADVDALGIPDSRELDDGLLAIYVGELKTEFIACGEHMGPLPNDVLVHLHQCRTDYSVDVEGRPE